MTIIDRVRASAKRRPEAGGYVIFVYNLAVACKDGTLDLPAEGRLQLLDLAYSRLPTLGSDSTEGSLFRGIEENLSLSLLQDPGLLPVVRGLLPGAAVESALGPHFIAVANHLGRACNDTNRTMFLSDTGEDRQLLAALPGVVGLCEELAVRERTSSESADALGSIILRLWRLCGVASVCSVDADVDAAFQRIDALCDRWRSWGPKSFDSDDICDKIRRSGGFRTQVLAGLVGEWDKWMGEFIAKMKEKGPEFDRGLSLLNLLLRLVSEGKSAKKKSYSLRKATMLLVAQLRAMKAYEALDSLGYPRD
jgi:hypothetical protein